jgi:hypothetical protein
MTTGIPMTRERYIQAVREAALKVAVLEPAEREMLGGLKMVYGTGYGTGARGITYFSAWKRSEGPGCGRDGHDSLIEICAFAEESLVQLAGTTIHELGHALAGKGKGHSKDWLTACKRLGLRGIKAAGTTYQSAMFVPALREILAALPVPADGKVIGWNAAGPGLAVIQGLTRIRPCAAGVGSRGGKSRGVGSGSRLRKWVCECGVIARVSSDDFRASCGRCGSDFKRA